MKITKKVWILLDINKKLIVKGLTSHRTIDFIENPETRKRISTYNNKAQALRSSNSLYSIYGITERMSDYLLKSYGVVTKNGWMEVKDIRKLFTAVESEETICFE